MVVISNSQRDQSVRYLQHLSELVKDDDRIKVVNLRRLSLKLAKELAKREKK